MITVLIAGGSGTRLWPLSTPDYPKHLLCLTGQRSLLQYTFDRASAIGTTTYVLTDESHATYVKQQLPELKPEAFIIEPGRRGTANCIIAALNRIAKEHDSSEPIAFLAADHYIRDTAGFVHSFKIAEAISKQAKRIVLVGAEPDHPATGFGYIQKDGLFDEANFVFNVHSFKEKPDFKTAQQYINSGNYLWNCSYFVGSVDTFKDAMQKYAPELYDNYLSIGKITDKKLYDKTYLSFESISIDYALIEKVTDLLVVPASFDWMDLGSYGDLQKAIGSDASGNHVKGENVELEGVENSFIHNDGGVPVAVVGLDNVVIVNTDKGLLVARKDLAQKVGDVSKRFNV